MVSKGENGENPANGISNRMTWQGTTAADLNFRIHNSQRSVVNLWYFITLLFMAGVFLPAMSGMDMMNGGYGLSFLSGFMVIVGFIVIIVYRSRAKQLDKIITGDGRLALWHYTPEEWIRFIASDFEEEKTVKKNMFILVVAIALIVGVILMIVIQDPLIMLIIAGIIVLVAIPAYWAPRYRYRKLKKSKTFALIAENGVVIGEMFHLWVNMGASLDDVSLNVNENPNLMEFTYSYPVRHGRQEEVARVPVPYGKYDEAVDILKHFRVKY